MSRIVNRRGFTLIELLVVIAIIAILAAILFPVFARAREKARQTTCTSNQRQIAATVQMYAQDHEETFPSTGNVWSVIGTDPGVLICPSLGKNTPNGYVYFSGIAGQSVGSVSDPTTAGITADGKGVSSTAPGDVNIGYIRADIDGKRHSGSCIVSYADGHVASTQTTPFPGDAPPIQTGIVFWIRASDGITKDGANKVSSWSDLSGNGLNGTQATAASQPLYTASVTDLNGKPAIYYDGADDNIATPDMGTFWASKTGTMFVVFRPTADLGFDLIHDLNSYGDSYCRNTDGNNYWGFLRKTARIETYPAINTVPSDGPCVVAVSSTLNTYQGFINGAAMGAKTPDWPTNYIPGVWNIGGYGNNAGRLKGYIAEVILYTTGMSDGQVKSVNDYLKAKYAIK